MQPSGDRLCDGWCCCCRHRGWLCRSGHWRSVSFVNAWGACWCCHTTATAGTGTSTSTSTGTGPGASGGTSGRVDKHDVRLRVRSSIAVASTAIAACSHQLCRLLLGDCVGQGHSHSCSVAWRCPLPQPGRGVVVERPLHHCRVDTAPVSRQHLALHLARGAGLCTRGFAGKAAPALAVLHPQLVPHGSEASSHGGRDVHGARLVWACLGISAVAATLGACKG